MSQQCNSFQEIPTSSHDSVRSNFNPNNAPEGTSSILKALGAQACVNNTTAVGAIFPPMGGISTTAVGCEKLAVMSTNIQNAQNVLNCKLTEVQNTKSTNVTSTVKVIGTIKNSNIGGNVNVSAVNNVQVISSNMFTNDIKNEMSSTLSNLAKSVKDVTQSEVKKGFASPSDGQKVVSQFNSSSSQNIEQSDMSKLVNTSINKFFGSTEVYMYIEDSTVGADVVITASNLVTACVTDMVSNTLSSIFTADATNVVAETFGLTQSSESSNELSFAFGGIVLLFFAMVVYGVYKMRHRLMIFRSLMGMMIGLGLILMVLGTLGVLLDLFNILISSVLMSVGALCLSYAFYLYRIRYRQTTNITNVNNNTNNINIQNTK
jgi:hypothetical protein